MAIVSGFLALAALAFNPAPSAQKWCFIVAGDGRSDNRTPRPTDHNGVNVVITSEVTDAVLKEKAKFLLWTGDLAYGYEKDPAVFEKQLLTWRALMRPLYDRHIPVLPTRGNHDMSSTNAEQVWNKVFTGQYALPQNGPDSEKNLTFYFGKGNVLVIGLDQYKAGKEEVNQEWLDTVLQTKKKPFIFAYGHEPAFMDGHHEDTLDVNPDKRDAFWESLIKSGSRVFFAGHDHLYDHMIVTRGTGNPGPEMHQIVAGTAGAPFYKPGDYAGRNSYWKLKRVKNIGYTFGYVVVEIDGNKATITFKGRTGPGKYEEMDSFSYTVN